MEFRGVLRINQYIVRNYYVPFSKGALILSLLMNHVEKPVIILGCGLWGSLIALRLKANNFSNFKLYGDPACEEMSLSFHQKDMSEEDFNFLEPFIDQMWKSFKVKFPEAHKIIHDGYCFVDRPSFYKKMSETLQDHFVPFEISCEEASKQGSFVIDTRNLGYFKAQAYRKTLSLKILCESPHEIQVPVTMDALVNQDSGFRYIQLLPLDEKTLFVKDTRYSTDPHLYHQNFYKELSKALKERSIWGQILKEENDFRKIPLHKNYPANEGRVLKIDGILHETSGDILPDALKLSKLISQTSMRLGEIRETIKNYRDKKDSKTRIYKWINKILYGASTPCHEKYYFFQFLYQLPAEIRYKFYSGEVQFKDLGRSLYLQPLSLLKFKTVKILDISSHFRLFRFLNS